MWALGFFLGLLLANDIAAGKSVERELEECMENIDLEKLEKFAELEEDDLQLICPMMSNLFECVDNVVVKHVGVTVAELPDLVPQEEVKRGVDLFVNTRSLLSDLCTAGTDLNEAYRAHSECFESLEVDEKGCERTAIAAYETYKELEDRVQDAAGDNRRRDNRMCMVQAYKFACLGAQVHEHCGQSAFEFFQTLIKRSTAFSNAFCTQGQLKEVKTKFLDSLDLEEPQRAIYKFAFDLRRRRKRSVAQ